MKNDKITEILDKIHNIQNFQSETQENIKHNQEHHQDSISLDITYILVAHVRKMS